MIGNIGGFGGGKENPNNDESVVKKVKKVEKAEGKKIKIKCPNCGSVKVEYEEGNETTECHCPDCDFTGLVNNLKKGKVGKVYYKGVKEVGSGDVNED